MAMSPLCNPRNIRPSGAKRMHWGKLRPDRTVTLSKSVGRAAARRMGKIARRTESVNSERFIIIMDSLVAWSPARIRLTEEKPALFGNGKAFGGAGIQDVKKGSLPNRHSRLREFPL